MYFSSPHVLPEEGRYGAALGDEDFGSLFDPRAGARKDDFWGVWVAVQLQTGCDDPAIDVRQVILQATTDSGVNLLASVRLA